MRFVQRDAMGQVIAHFANPQRDRDGTPYATECIPDDHPDIVAFADRREQARSVDRERYGVRGLEARITALEAEVARLREGR